MNVHKISMQRDKIQYFVSEYQILRFPQLKFSKRNNFP